MFLKKIKDEITFLNQCKISVGENIYISIRKKMLQPIYRSIRPMMRNYQPTWLQILKWFSLVQKIISPHTLVWLFLFQKVDNPACNFENFGTQPQDQPQDQHKNQPQHHRPQRPSMKKITVLHSKNLLLYF